MTRPDPHLPPAGHEYHQSYPVLDLTTRLYGYELLGVTDCWSSGPVYADREMATRAGGKMLAWTQRRLAGEAT